MVCLVDRWLGGAGSWRTHTLPAARAIDNIIFRRFGICSFQSIGIGQLVIRESAVWIKTWMDERQAYIRIMKSIKMLKMPMMRVTFP